MSVEGASSQPEERPKQAPSANAPKLAEKTIEIKLSVPTYDVRAALMPAWLHLQSKALLIPRRILIVGGGVSLLLITSFGTYQWLSHHTTAAADVTSIAQSVPDYPTKLPAGKTIKALGGWTRVSPPDRNPVFAYEDKIGSAAISVSQQPLPDTFKKDTAQKVQQLAVDFNATEKVTVNHDTIYIGTSARGPQSVIFSKDNLLILIKSRVRIDTNAWTKYISSLK